MVTLTTTQQGSSSSVQQKITVTAPSPKLQPSFSWSPQQPTAGQPITFTDTTTGPHQVAEWRFGQGNPGVSNAPSPSVAWASSGDYQVTLVVTGADGSRYETPRTVSVGPAPPTLQASFAFSPQQLLVGQKATFTDTSAGPPHDSQWSFDHGSPASATGQSTEVVWHTTGTHTVGLTVTGTGAASSQTAHFSGPVAVGPMPTPTFTSVSQPVAGLTVTFTDTTPGGPYQDTWSFQGIGARTGSSVTVSWPQVSPVGGYQAQLTIAAAGNISPQPGETATTTQPITVYPHALPNPDCIPYSPSGLKLVNLGISGWQLVDGSTAMEIFENSSDAQAAWQVAQHYSQQCFIGRENTRSNRMQYIVDYWMGGGPAPTLPGEDCISYSPQGLSLVNLGPAGWQLVDKGLDMEILDNSSDAQAALQLAQQYTKQCFIGRENTLSNRLDYIVQYWK
jgi:PKD repeat protein